MDGDDIAILKAQCELLRWMIIVVSRPLIGIFWYEVTFQVTQRIALKLPTSQVFIAAQLAFSYDGQSSCS